MQFKGLYFVLMGRLSPLDGIGPDQLKIEDLTKLLKDRGIKEIILANSPTIEGEATASYIASIADDLEVKATRIAYGVPMGGELEYVDSNTSFQPMIRLYKPESGLLGGSRRIFINVERPGIFLNHAGIHGHLTHIVQ